MTASLAASRMAYSHFTQWGTAKEPPIRYGCRNAGISLKTAPIILGALQISLVSSFLISTVTKDQLGYSVPMT